MLNFLWIALGGALGSVLRYSISLALPYANVGFPKATFVTNVIACFIVGFVSGLLLIKFPDATWLKYFLLIGFCGGFSTFSTFALEIFKLNSIPNMGMTIAYVLASIVVGVAAVYFGFWSIKIINPS